MLMLYNYYFGCVSSGSPLFWVGVGVGLSALFSWVRMWITCMLYGLVFVYNFSFLCICLDDLNFMAGGFKVEGEFHKTYIE